jgi:hypothetical protein
MKSTNNVSFIAEDLHQNPYENTHPPDNVNIASFAPDEKFLPYPVYLQDMLLKNNSPKRCLSPHGASPLTYTVLG